jgi:hypothetical protein
LIEEATLFPDQNRPTSFVRPEVILHQHI